MSTITLNGTASNTKTGLIISRMPPITRPKMRYQQVTVDGRPGDIVTELGYEAYDREFEIGLAGAFDIDEITAYFSGSGKAVFSNEDDKEYDYTFLERVDYEKLLRFKTAKVKMHVQPYKHEYNETPTVITPAGGTFTLTNKGNTPSAPSLDIIGSGIVTFSVPDGLLTRTFQVDMTDDAEVIVDTEALECYFGTVLKNRLVTGNIGTFRLQPGANTITYTGTVTQVTATNISRWI